MNKISIEKLKNSKQMPDLYEGPIKIEGKNVMICIDIDLDKNDLESKVSFANKTLNWYKKNSKKVKKYASDKLLDLRNKNWIESKKEVVTEKEFIGRIKIRELAIKKDKSVAIFFDDDNLFFGHRIMIDMNKNYKFTDSDIIG